MPSRDVSSACLPHAQVWASECVVDVGIPTVAASTVWSLNGTAALVATRLGTTLRYILQQHSMWHMAQVHSVACRKPYIVNPKPQEVLRYRS